LGQKSSFFAVFPCNKSLKYGIISYKQSDLGGEDLKKPIFVLILFCCKFGIGLFVLLPLNSLYAQETPAENAFVDISEQEAVPEEDALITAEQAFTFNYNSDAPPAAGSSIWAVIRMLLVLALAAVAIYGIVFFLKKKSTGKKITDDPFLKVLANSHLGNNRYAHIVSVGNKAWLLGSSDGGVSLIGEIDDKELIDAMILEDSKKDAEAASSRMPDFMSLLRKLGAPVDNKNPDADDLRKRRERLKGM